MFSLSENALTRAAAPFPRRRPSPRSPAQQKRRVSQCVPASNSRRCVLTGLCHARNRHAPRAFPTSLLFVPIPSPLSSSFSLSSSSSRFSSPSCLPSAPPPHTGDTVRARGGGRGRGPPQHGARLEAPCPVPGSPGQPLREFSSSYEGSSSSTLPSSSSGRARVKRDGSLQKEAHE